MANKTLFKSIVGKLFPKPDTLNEEGAPAYAFDPKHALAQYAVTGCLNSTFYVSQEDQLQQILKLCAEVDGKFIAQLALYCREKGFMKDVPALLCAVLSVKEREALKKVFPRVVGNTKMLRNFVQILRSGVVGRKSLGSFPKKLILNWLEERSEEELFLGSVGNDPSLADVLKMVHPKPSSKAREALYGYLISKEHSKEELPQVVKAFEAYKAGASKELPNVPFQLLTSLPLGRAEWTQIARNMSWRATVMNLNTFARQEVFSAENSEADKIVGLVADRIRNRDAILKAKAFPYQLMVAYQNITEGVPSLIREALQDALEIALENVPTLSGKVYVCPDVSGSMSSPATGYRKGSSSVVRCIDVAALMAASILRKNSQAEILPFEQDVVSIQINPRDTVLTNAEKLAAIGGGGTNCSAPLKQLNEEKARGDLVILISDNQSWMGEKSYQTTPLLQEWSLFKKRNPNARLVCIDIQPYANTQAMEREDILNIGGFSDQVFEILSSFQEGTLNPNHWIGTIEQIAI